RFLSYMPSSIDEVAQRGERSDPPSRREPWLIEAIPRDIRKPYKMRSIVEAVVDKGSFFEIGSLYGRSIITGLGPLGAGPAAVVASAPYFYGCAGAADTR